MSQCIRSGSIEFNMGSNYNPPQSFFRECQPIHSNEELLNFCKRPTIWSDLAYPLASRCVPVLLGDDFRQIQMRDRTDRTPDFVLEVSRPKVFVCHDLAGNYRDDRYNNLVLHTICVSKNLNQTGVLVSFVVSPKARANGTIIVSTIGLASIIFAISARIT